MFGKQPQGSLFPAPRKFSPDLLLFAVVFLVGVYCRTSGLFRGLGEQGNIFHPDEPKQVMALFNFLKGEYVRYYGSLFYDGYPYGLNHLDEYILRPLLALFQNEPPDYQALYFPARALRLLYSIAILLLSGRIALLLLRSKTAALLILLLMGLAPLPITVGHFATGDIGVDLFTALAILLMTLFIGKGRRKIFMFLVGLCIGAAFSAKYNGLLLAILPLATLALLFLQGESLTFFCKNCLVLGLGSLTGLLLFTPNLLIDFRTTAANILANFEFIKNYNVPQEVIEMSWGKKAVLGLRNNTLPILTSLGITASVLYFAGLAVISRRFFAERRQAVGPGARPTALLLALATLPVCALFISLTGKYVVQPFHFSYLQLPILLVCCYLLMLLFRSETLLMRGLGLAALGMLVVEFGTVSLEENFFWRHEDNGYHAETLPATIFDREAFYTHRSAPFRNLFLEELSPSIFKNHSFSAKGPDAPFWRALDVAPLPQVANPVGRDWIFLNGPSFPRNERKIVIAGDNHGTTIKRYLVVPMQAEIAAIGVQSGSYPTEAEIVLGGDRLLCRLEADEQRVLPVSPSHWRLSGEGPNQVRIVPLEVTVKHNTLWLTVFRNDRERDLFSLFGGEPGDKGPPAALPRPLQEDYFDALSRIKYLEQTLSWRVAEGQQIPMWEVALPAGRYRLFCEIDGLDESSRIAVSFEDAKGEAHSRQRREFPIGKGLQRIEYPFNKPFSPHQLRFLISGLEGRSQVLKFSLVPDYRGLQHDFEAWRQEGVRPQWCVRFKPGGDPRSAD